MAARANTLSPLLVGYTSLRKLLLQVAQIPLQTAPSSRTIPPSAERHLLTFMAAVCSLHPDCDEAAVAVARGTPPSVDTTLYVAAIHASAPLQSAFRRFIGDLRAAYDASQDVVGACGNHVLAAMYRFAYPVLHQCLWNDDRYQQVLSYFGTDARPLVQQALEKLKTITKESDSAAIAEDVLRDMHKSCGVIHTFVRDHGIPGPVMESFLADIVSVCVVASDFDPIIFGACLSDKDVESLMKDTRGCGWEIVWIPSPATPSAPFEAEVSTSAVATWLEDYSQCSSILPWNEAISQIASCCPTPLTKTGSRYTSDEPPSDSIHCEITLLLWLIHHDIPVDLHIGYSSVVCYLCAKLAQALGGAYPKHDIALSGIFHSTTIELPWTCPPDVPDAVIEPLRTIILKDFRRDALTYVARDGAYEDALGTEVPEFPKHDE